MIKNSPLFIQKILTLTLFSFFLSVLISMFDVPSIENVSHKKSIFIILTFEIFIGAIFFSLIYFLYKRKNIARIILIFLIILGVMAYLFSLLVESYSTFQGLLYLFSMLLDIYTLILLLGADAKSFIKSGYVKNEVDGSFKTWFSTLSSVLLIMIIGAKFLNKYEFKNQTYVESEKKSEDVSIENQIEDVSAKFDDIEGESLASENDPDYRDEGAVEESYEDVGEVNAVRQMVEGQPIAVRFGVNEFNTSLYDKVAYDIVVQGRADEEVIVYDVVLNRGNQCGLSSYAREKQLPSSLKFGEYVALSIGGCDAQMVQEIEVKTNFGSYMFGPQN